MIIERMFWDILWKLFFVHLFNVYLKTYVEFQPKNWRLRSYDTGYNKSRAFVGNIQGGAQQIFSLTATTYADVLAINNKQYVLFRNGALHWW